METTIALIIGMLIGAAITLWTQWACDEVEGAPGHDDKPDQSYLD